MCLVCLDWEKGKLTSKEALRALGELIGSSEGAEVKHYFEISSKILDKEVPLNDNDEELDRSWHDETHDD